MSAFRLVPSISLLLIYLYGVRVAAQSPKLDSLTSANDNVRAEQPSFMSPVSQSKTFAAHVVSQHAQSITIPVLQSQHFALDIVSPPQHHFAASAATQSEQRFAPNTVSPPQQQFTASQANQFVISTVSVAKPLAASSVSQSQQQFLQQAQQNSKQHLQQSTPAQNPKTREGAETRALSRLSDAQLLSPNSPIGRLGLSSAASVQKMVTVFAVVVILLIVCYMQPQVHGNSNLRLPPRWEPGLENSLPFRTWLQDLLLWTITSDMEPHRQAAAIISQLGGAARELARTLSPQEIFHGGVVNGQRLDPVSFLIHGLSQRFSPLDDEIRIRAAQDLLHFQRRGNESIDVLVSRFETIRSRARTEGGGANISTESAALILLRAVGVTAEQFQRLTQPYGMRLPNTEQEFSQLLHQLRRMGHIIEHHPSNVASTLRAQPSSNQSGQSYVSFPDQGQTELSHPSSWSFVGYPDPWPTGQAHHSQSSHQSWSQPSSAADVGDWAFYRGPAIDGASDTDSATESDDGAEDMMDDDLAGLSAQQADEHLFWQYAEAKRRWRRYTGKPVRALRRVLRKKGKGKGKPHHSFFDISEALQQSAYFKGKGKGGKSSGKGFGRKINPKGRNGEVLKCSICDSMYHLRARCPQNPQRSAQGSGRPTASSGPQSAQLPFPPNRSQPSVAGFATANSVTQSDGQIGPASLHFATSEVRPEQPEAETPRPSTSRPEEHPLTPEDPWMNWHHDPWVSNVPVQQQQQQQQETVPIFENGPITYLPGLWPPPTPGGFPGSPLELTQSMSQRPEVGMSLLPDSEAQIMTRMFNTVHLMQDEGSESEIPPGIRLQRLLGLGIVAQASQPVSQPAPQPAEIQQPEGSAGLRDMFSEVHRLRQSRSSPVVPAQEQTATTLPLPRAVHYQGDNTACSICQVEFRNADGVLRLPCRHIFHQTCFDEYVARSDGPVSCPNCRGSGEVVASWQFVSEARAQASEQTAAQPQATAQPTATETPPATSRSSTSFHTPATDVDVAFPWWPVPPAVPALTYHTSTHRTQSGQLGLLVDPGSYGNLVGEEWVVAASQEANRAGLHTAKHRKTSPLEVGGVGQGTQKCFEEITIPTALRSSDGAMTGGSYTAPVIPRSACPALLGLKSLVQHRSVLDLVNNRLILLPKGAEVEVPAGAEVLSLEQAETGHLLLPIDDFSRLTEARRNLQAGRNRHMFADGQAQDQTDPSLTSRASSSTAGASAAAAASSSATARPAQTE